MVIVHFSLAKEKFVALMRILAREKGFFCI
ncbi:hypothetical protein V441_34365 [Pseudomonas aeruginosa DHS29]|nr:hypothetical protein V441_34365 [Pseudomonas aeruginosa DHS29]